MSTAKPGFISVLVLNCKGVGLSGMTSGGGSGYQGM